MGFGMILLAHRPLWGNKIFFVVSFIISLYVLLHRTISFSKRFLGWFFLIYLSFWSFLFVFCVVFHIVLLVFTVFFSLNKHAGYSVWFNVFAFAFKVSPPLSCDIKSIAFILLVSILVGIACSMLLMIILYRTVFFRFPSSILLFFAVIRQYIFFKSVIRFFWCQYI